MLEEPEDWLQELALVNLGPEDGCLGVIDSLGGGPNEVVAITAFTDAGIEALREVAADARRRREGPIQLPKYF
ncbi:hypothetical protein AB6809_33600 [Paraburkholderia sp. RCC_158]|uniref:hypothetical protein n=1 Tax=Paraburkholderia sp. RCC_158 TaxID=3239220 RepID=UPI00352620A1